MRTPLALGCTLALLLCAAPAHALDHLMRVNEVYLDNGSGAQYVEFNDPSPESLPNGPYRLEVYDADANLVDMVTLTGITAGSDIFYVAGNAAADLEFGTGTTDVQFTFTLPENGQACFVRGTGGKIHCVAWGCINTPASANASTAAIPGVDESVSRQSLGTYQITTPTPGAANGTGADEAACATGTPDAGPPPDAADPSAPDSGSGGGPDAGDGSGGGEDGGGCGCRGGASGGGGAAGLLLLAALVSARRRARRGSRARGRAARPG